MVYVGSKKGKGRGTLGTPPLLSPFSLSASLLPTGKGYQCAVFFGVEGYLGGLAALLSVGLLL